MEIGFFSSTIVQVAISIVISWALFALLCSMVHEIFIQLKNERGRFFRRKVHEKLFDAPNQINWGILLYSHSSIKLLTRSEKAPPAEINSKTFAEALMDIVANSHAASMLKIGRTLPHATFKSALLNNLEFAADNLQQSDIITVLRNALTKAKIRAMTGTVYDEEKVFDTVADDLQHWFDLFGERTTAWYKKLSRKRLFVIGLVVCCFTNIDSIALFQYYSDNPAARAGIIEYYTKHKLELEELSKNLEARADGSATAVIENKKDDIAIRNEIKSVSTEINHLKNSLKLPIGWENNVCLAGSNNKESHQSDCSFTNCILYKILGLLISAFAASLGAPFWFDILRKATKVNETIITPKPAKP